MDFKPVQNAGINEYLRVKPARQTGLWTSTFNPDIGSRWIEWCEFERFRVPEIWEGTLLYPAKSARIYIIDSLKDLNNLLNIHKHHICEKDSPSFRPARLFIDFESARQKYDGIHLTEKGQDETRYSTPNDLYGWDCESTVWLNWCFEKTEPYYKNTNQKV